MILLIADISNKYESVKYKNDATAFLSLFFYSHILFFIWLIYLSKG